MVVDECHLVCTAESYRRRMQEVKRLRMLRYQFVFLTATLPNQMVLGFSKALLLERPLIIRSVTVRQDLEYHVVPRYPTASLVRAAAGNIKAVLEQDWFVTGGRSRAIVYTRTRLQADEMAAEMGCPTYYSDSGTTDEKAAVLVD